jgi:tRNA (guanine37-N1)-methyltransferase
MFDIPAGPQYPQKAQEKGLISIRLVDPRAFTTDRHPSPTIIPMVGARMVMKPNLWYRPSKIFARTVQGKSRIAFTPRSSFHARKAAELVTREDLVLVCGRYEGVDERVKSFVDEELSVGDFTLSGGEPAAIVVIDAVARLIPGVLGNEKSAGDESFSNGLLEYPQYTRPEDFRGMKVPKVLLSGDHERIRQWRRETSVRLTMDRRPDLLSKATLTLEEKAKASGIKAPIYVALLHHPVYDKNGQVVTTAVTNMDIHDIAPLGKDLRIHGFYVVTPVKPLQS